MAMNPYSLEIYLFSPTRFGNNETSGYNIRVATETPRYDSRELPRCQVTIAVNYRDVMVTIAVYTQLRCFGYNSHVPNEFFL